MTTKPSAHTERWLTLRDRVTRWADAHARDDLRYGAPYSWWRKALAAGVCTQEEHDLAKETYGGLWNYRGD